MARQVAPKLMLAKYIGQNGKTGFPIFWEAGLFTNVETVSHVF